MMGRSTVRWSAGCGFVFQARLPQGHQGTESRYPHPGHHQQTRPRPAVLLELGTDTCNPKVTAWNYKRLDKMRAQGISFNVWTVDDELTMKALINTGVNGIITNYPQSPIGLLEQQ